MSEKIEVKIPRWYYRDVQVGVSTIRENAKTIGSVRGAMVEYIHQRKDRLPAGMTAEKAVDEMLKTVDSFAVAHSEGKTQEDIKKAIQDAIGEMESKQALAYLAVLEATFRACDAGAANEGRIPDVETIQRGIREAVDGAAGGDIDERIAKLAEMIQGDSLAAYVYAAGNDQIKPLIEGNKGMAEEVPSEVAIQIHEAMLSAEGKAEIYAATVCACYGMVLDGKIEGVSPDKLDVGVMTALVVAGMEKASIFTRLARGEIDSELALKMLSALSRTLKWILVTILQVIAAVCLFDIFATIITSIAWLTAASSIFLALGMVIAVFAAVDCREDFEKIVDFLGSLIKSAAKLVCGAVAWVWNKGRELVEAATSTESVENTMPNAMPAC